MLQKLQLLAEVGATGPPALTQPSPVAEAIQLTDCYLLAAGRRAKAIHTGAFVWADSSNADFASTAANQFLIRADAVEIGNGTPIALVLSAADALEFPSTGSQTSSYLTITVTGAVNGDVISLGMPNSGAMSDADYSAWVSAANTVTVRFNNFSASTSDPPSGTLRVMVTRFWNKQTDLP